MKIADFKTDMLVICKPEKVKPTSDKSFFIYARVLAIDNTNRRILLDKYMEEGKLHCIGKGNESRWNDFDEEYAGYYHPMTNDEILAFEKGLSELLSARKQYHREDKGMIEATLDKVRDRASLIIEGVEKESEPIER